MTLIVVAQLGFVTVNAVFLRVEVSGLCSFRSLPRFPENQISQKSLAKRSPELVPVTVQGGVGSRCLPARAVVRAVTATKHELGLPPSSRVVSCGSAPTENASLSLPVCTQQGTCRGAVLACRFDPLAFSGDKRGRSKALFFAVRIETSIGQSARTCHNFSCNPENWAISAHISCLCSTIAKSTSSPLASAFRMCRAAVVPLVDPENFDASGVLGFEECLAHCHPPHWIPDRLQDRSWW